MNKIIMALLGTLLLPSLSYAVDFNNCRVTEVVSAGAKNTHVQLNCVIQNRPYCATAGNYFVFDHSTHEGQQYRSMVLTAFASGAKLSGYINRNQYTCPSYQTNVARLTHLRMKP